MAGPTIKGPPLPSGGITGLPAGTKEEGQRVDLKPDQFKLLVETKGGRFAWSRAMRCPCVGVNDQTDQPDPNCELCKTHPSWVYFKPDDYTMPDDVGDLDDVQAALLATNEATVIRGIQLNLSTNFDAFDKLGPWVFGTAMITVRASNVLGHYDRLIALDGETGYSENITIGAGATSTLKYLATGVNVVLDETGQQWRQGVHFTVEAGVICWYDSGKPPVGTRVGVHYLCHPTWVVWEHPNAYRHTLVKAKTPNPTTPRGNPTALPVRAMCRLEFLIDQ